tara:strand:+ start:1011 stop:1346 length:336 start_codon:yes stop_codon:yes gene_type:complete
MFSTLKLYAGIAFSALAALFLILFKRRGAEIDRLEEREEQLEQVVERAEDIQFVTEAIDKEYTEAQKQIDEEYHEKQEEVYKTTDKPLSPSLLDKLRSVQGMGTDSHKSPE